MTVVGLYLVLTSYQGAVELDQTAHDQGYQVSVICSGVLTIWTVLPAAGGLLPSQRTAIHSVVPLECFKKFFSFPCCTY